MYLRVRTFAVSAALLGAPALALASSLAVTVLDGSGKPLPDVVVYAEPDGPLPKPMKPAEIEQKGLAFIPLVTVIQTGSRINFPNNDKVRHHIYSFSAPHKFDQKLYSGVTASPQVFDKPGTVVLGCNIHDKMIAYVKIVDTPFFAKTDASGTAHIELPAAGKYALHAWHYRMAAASADQQAQVKPGDTPTTASFTLALKPPVVAAPDSTDF